MTTAFTRVGCTWLWSFSTEKHFKIESIAKARWKRALLWRSPDRSLPALHMPLGTRSFTVISNRRTSSSQSHLREWKDHRAYPSQTLLILVLRYGSTAWHSLI